MRSGYTYGDSPEAARRLELLDEVYAEVTVPFLRRYAPARPALAIDLGCGPGHTTARMLDTLEPADLVGVDASPAFLDEARRRVPQARFIQVDLSTGQTPWSGAAVIFCRFLLGHLPQPDAILDRWLASLAPGGLVLIQEYAWIRSSEAVVERYLELSEGMVRATGADLRLGEALATMAEERRDRGDVAVLRSDESSFEVGLDRMAEVFRLNIPALRARAVAPPQQLDALEADLFEASRGGGAVTACVREVAIRR